MPPIPNTPSSPHPIAGVATAITAFVGGAGRGPVGDPVPVVNFAEYGRVFGGLSLSSPMAYAVRDYFLNGGSQAIVVRLAGGATPTMADYRGDGVGMGLFALEKADLFNLLCLPPATFDGGTAPDTPAQVYQLALSYCVRRRALLLVDPPRSWASAGDILAGGASKLTALGLSGPDAHNAALYFPRVLEADPLRGGQAGAFVPCGVVAGVLSRTDTQHGVWKAPAGAEASVKGTTGLEHTLTDGENGRLNALGVNCLRTFPALGSVVWGARTLGGADSMADDYKYVPVRRLALFLEESLDRGTRWAAFEPNAEPLWAQLRLDVGAFLQDLFRRGAFQGATPAQAYFVKCDRQTTTQSDIGQGIVNIVVGFAPLRSAEFVVLNLRQKAE